MSEEKFDKTNEVESSVTEKVEEKVIDNDDKTLNSAKYFGDDGKKVEEWEEQTFARNRYNTWLGSEMPKTISAKEIADNAIDQASEGLAKNIVLILTNNSIVAMDDGKGISTELSKKSGKPHLYQAVAKLYTSTNYEGSENVTGNNGVGATMTNFLSSEFIAGQVDEGTLTGYVFHDGKHESDGYELDTLENFDAPMAKGFYVSANYDKDILKDKINIEWIDKYVKDRVGELPKGATVTVQYEHAGETVTHTYDRKEGSENYVPSWIEKVKEIEGAVYTKRIDGWVFAFAKKAAAFDKINSMVQGSPVPNNTHNLTSSYEVEDTIIRVNVPFTFYYSGNDAPAYTDQTKQGVTLYNSKVLEKFRLFKALDAYFKAEAEKFYLRKQLSDKGMISYWPAIGNSGGYKELLIAEGFSAIDAVKEKRDNKTQALFALRGKIKNSYLLRLNKAMKSPVVKELLGVLANNDFDKIIFVTDADSHGYHIASLLLGLFATHTDYLQNGRVYFCKTPLYIFRKRGQAPKWSDNPNDVPKGWKTRVNKGLGSLTAEDVKLFITDDSTRQIYQYVYDGQEADDAMFNAMYTGGKSWVDEEEDSHLEMETSMVKFK